MNILIFMIPVSLLMGGIGLAAFFWALRNKQFEDPKGDGERMLSSEWDDRPKP